MTPRVDQQAMVQVRSLRIDRMAGIRTAFQIDAFCQGINLIHGPNGIGKSRTATALQALLWPSTGTKRDEISGSIGVSDDVWRVDLEIGRARYQRNDSPEATEVPVSVPASQRDRYVLSLQDLLRADNRNFAREIAREAAGGIDLNRARQELHIANTPKRPKKTTIELREATATIAELRQKDKTLASQEASLDELKSDMAAAVAASERVRLLRIAQTHLEALESQVRSRIARDAYPKAIQRMTGQEYEEARSIRSRLADLEANLKAIGLTLEEASRELASTGLAEVTVPRTLIPLLRDYLEQARRHLADCQQAARRMETASDQLLRARTRIAASITDDQLASLDSDGLRELADHVAMEANARAMMGIQERVRKWLGPCERPEDLDTLRRGVDILQQHIGAQQSAASDQSPHVRWIMIGSAGVIVIATIALAATTEIWMLVLALLAIPLLLVALSSGGTGTQDLRQLSDSYLRLGLAPPSAWSLEATRLRLDELQRGVAEARLEEEKFQRWQDLTNNREEAETRLHDLRTKNDELRHTYGVVAGDNGADALRLIAEAIAQWRRAQDDDAAARIDHEGASVLLRQAIASVNANARFFADGEVGDVAQAAAAIEDLVSRNTMAERLSSSIERDRRRLDAELGPEIDDLKLRLEETYRRAGLDNGDDAGLKARCDAVEQFTTVQRACDNADVVVNTRRDELRTDPALVDASRETIDLELTQASALAARRDDIQAQISTIEAEIRQARHATHLEHAIVREAEALDLLAEHRQQEYEAVAVSRAFAMIQNHDRQQNRPAVFRAADAYFIRFTSGAYSLTMGEGDDTDLFAVDTATGGVLTLDQLSSGTRVQLLLAVRLAFIDVTERGARLPVILDEALGNTDDTRATAIIDAAIEIAREGRQVLYFTAQHDEIGKWLARLNAHNHAPVSSVIDLEAIRASAQAQSPAAYEWDASIFALDSIDPLATYDDLRGLLSVPPIDLWAETTDGHHVWYFITHPEALVKLHDRGIRLWGQYGALSRASRLEGIATSTTHAKAQARAKVIETVCREWRYGRPRPLTIERLHESGLITPRFWDDVVACAASKAWDGGALITALQNREISGFFRTTTESLENWLREYGHIVDDIAPRPDAMIRAAAMSAGDATGILDPDETDALLLNMTGAALTAPLAQSAGLQVATAKMP